MNLLADDTVKILLVEDMPVTAERLKATLEDTLPVDVQIQADFDEALAALHPPRSFEVVILDLFLGDPIDAANNAGQRVWEQIWRTKLMPVIIYTANESDLDPELPIDNPFIRLFTKQAGSDEAIAEYLSTILPYVQVLRDVEQEVSRATNDVLQHIAPLIWQTTQEDEGLRAELLMRSSRRRLAALMDLTTDVQGTTLQSWEQYVYPPIGDGLLMGDVLRTLNGATNDPTAYRVVLTPSCDMQMNNGRCKVDVVLTARCTGIDNYVRVIRDTFRVRQGDIRERLPRFLTEPHTGGYVPLPEYRSVLPHMAVNLRDLDLVRVADVIGDNVVERIYKRVVSVDSPFREHLAWAYLQVAGRPGVPNRDLDTWTTTILAALQPPERNE